MCFYHKIKFRNGNKRRGSSIPVLSTNNNSTNKNQNKTPLKSKQEPSSSTSKLKSNESISLVIDDKLSPRRNLSPPRNIGKKNYKNFSF